MSQAPVDVSKIICSATSQVPHSNEVNMKLIGKFVGVLKMIVEIEFSCTQTVITFSFDAENLAFIR